MGALDLRLSWFPDEIRIAYVDFIERRELTSKEFEGLRNSEMLAWGRIPAVHVLYIASGKKEMIQIGEKPVVNRDGTRILFRDVLENKWVLMDLSTGFIRSTIITWSNSQRSSIFLGSESCSLLGLSH